MKSVVLLNCPMEQGTRARDILLQYKYHAAGSSLFCPGQWYTQDFFSGGHLRTEDGENGDLGEVAP